MSTNSDSKEQNICSRAPWWESARGVTGTCTWLTGLVVFGACLLGYTPFNWGKVLALAFLFLAGAFFVIGDLVERERHYQEMKQVMEKSQQ